MSNFVLIFSVVWLLVMSFVMFQGKIMRQFNLVDKRKFVGSQETFNKLNSLMSRGDVSLYYYEYLVEPTARLTLTYQFPESESVTKRFENKDLSTVVTTAYAWAIENGYIKE